MAFDTLFDLGAERPIEYDIGDPSDYARQFAEIRPSRGFQLIMADPPWYFKNRSKKGEEKNATSKYDCMTTEEICAMPVDMLAGKDCVLWLWATNPMLPDAMKVIDAWGFTYKTAGTWSKKTKFWKIFFGTGYILRSSNEPFLIATKGNPKTTKSVRSIIEARVREHSRKPDEAFEYAEQLIPDIVEVDREDLFAAPMKANRLELFSRETRPNWVNWGNEKNKFDGADR